MNIKDQQIDNITEKDNIKSKSLWWNLCLKLLFIIILCFFIYRQLVSNDDLSITWNHFVSNLKNGTPLFLLICIVLMPVNWLVESEKWRILVIPFEKISRIRSIEAIMSGVSVAMITPNRIGEYGGRMVMVEAKNNWKAVISTLVSSYAQNIWNIGLGLMAAMFFLRASGQMEYYLFISGLIVSSIFLILLLVLYFNIHFVNIIIQRFNRYSLIKRSLKHLVLLDQYKSKTLLKVLNLALIRYLIYFIQYLLILKFFGLELSLLSAFIGIATIFLVQTSLPLPPILGFLARGEIALLVWQGAHFNELSVLASSYSLWLINLIIPALIGSLIILSSNLWRTLGLSHLIIRRK